MNDTLSLMDGSTHGNQNTAITQPRKCTENIPEHHLTALESESALKKWVDSLSVSANKQDVWDSRIELKKYEDSFDKRRVMKAALCRHDLRYTTWNRWLEGFEQDKIYPRILGDMRLIAG